METWPNFFIVGASKAGTTSLWAYLSEIPGIYMSPVKEPRYFGNEKMEYNAKLSVIKEEKKYLKLFEGIKDEKIIGEATPGYLRSVEACQLIYKKIPDARILISLRDPIDRVYSDFLMRKKLGNEKSTMQQVIKKIIKENNYSKEPYLQPSFYYKNVKRYLDTFGEEQVKIIIFEELIKNTNETMQDILKFLGINYKFQQSKEKKYNVYGTPRGKLGEFIIRNKTIEKIARKIISPKIRLYVRDDILIKKSKKPHMEENNKEFLQEVFNEDVQKISRLLGRKLPWKNFD